MEERKKGRNRPLTITSSASPPHRAPRGCCCVSMFIRGQRILFPGTSSTWNTSTRHQLALVAVQAAVITKCARRTLRKCSSCLGARCVVFVSFCLSFIFCSGPLHKHQMYIHTSNLPLLSLHCLPCLLHFNAVSPLCRGFVTISELGISPPRQNRHGRWVCWMSTGTIEGTIFDVENTHTVTSE